MTGRGTSGSWQIRGVQLAQSMGADAEPHARDVNGYDMAVLVKRPTEDLLHRLHQANVPLIWDVVDAWPQPNGNEWSRERCLEWLKEMIRKVRPAGIVAATHEMAADCAHIGVPVLSLPHHARPGLRANPIRPLKVVGYEGAPHYLGRWLPVIEQECAARGWMFVVNPAELADVDVVLALRDCDGYAPRNWKSNVKLANAQGSGTPVICNREAGYLETQSGAERWADNVAELAEAFDALTPTAERLAVSLQLLKAAPVIESVAATYLRWLRSSF
uniref:Glycosyltransferase n=1 Tax=Variovorax sp. HH01 TaxID=1084736 RepID=I3PCP3_9BURK|nr:hypothetical protein var073 [Variovorax sp. HH01]